MTGSTDEPARALSQVKSVIRTNYSGTTSYGGCVAANAREAKKKPRITGLSFDAGPADHVRDDGNGQRLRALLHAHATHAAHAATHAATHAAAMTATAFILR